MHERVDHREVSGDKDAGLRQCTFAVDDFSRDLAAVTVRLDAARARLLLRDLERLLAADVENFRLLILLRLFEVSSGDKAPPKVVEQQEIKAQAALHIQGLLGYHSIR
jgi:hypothetical protein